MALIRPSTTFRARTTATEAFDGDVLPIDATAAAVAVTLPTAVMGKVVTVIKTDSTINAVTVSPAAGTIDGAASVALGTQYQARTFLCDGTNWFTLKSDPIGALTRSVADLRTDNSVVNSTAQTTMFTLNVPTNLASGDEIRVRAGGDLLNNFGSNVSYTWILTLGVTQIAVSNALALSTSAQRRHWAFDASVLVVAPASSELAMGQLNIGPSGTTATMGMGSPSTGPFATSAAEDLTSTKALKLTVTLGTADANADCYCHSAVMSVARRAA